MTETETIKHLSDAIDSLDKARQSTQNGIIDDLVCNEIKDVVNIIVSIAGDIA